ncbi:MULTISPECIES: GDSL-type esterase/lipase family protein [Kitasatospora]|nr:MULTISPECIES: GDSL-type esterase/lipase family protein [Kitasatospora]
MGDSYISGEGGRWRGNGDGEARDSTDNGIGIYRGPNYLGIEENTSYLDGGNKCDRSNVAEIMMADLPGEVGVKKFNLACSGAKTDQFHDGWAEKSQVSQLDQLDYVARTNRVKMVVVSVGGNDVGFSDIIKACVKAYTLPFQGTCNEEQDKNFDSANLYLRTKVSTVLRSIKTKMRDAGYQPWDYSLVLQSYPRPLPAKIDDFTPDNRGNRGCPFKDADATWAATTMMEKLTNRLKEAADDVGGVRFLDLTDAFAGHELCSKFADLATTSGGVASNRAEWIRWLPDRLIEVGPLGAQQEAIHPNAYGQQALGACLTALAAYLEQGFRTGAWRFKCTNPGARPATEMGLSEDEDARYSLGVAVDPPVASGGSAALSTRGPWPVEGRRFLTSPGTLIPVGDLPATHAEPAAPEPGRTFAAAQSWTPVRDTVGGWQLRAPNGAALVADPGSGTVHLRDVGPVESDPYAASWQFHSDSQGHFWITHLREPRAVDIHPANMRRWCLTASEEDENSRLRLVPCSGLGEQQWKVENTASCTSLQSLGACDAAPVADADPVSVLMATGFLEKTMDKNIVNDLGVPQSYTGGHFGPGPEFGPNGFQASFTYDNAVIIASILQGRFRDVGRAVRLGDSLLYAQDHDPVDDGRIRASYLTDPFVTTLGRDYPAGTPYIGSWSVYTGNMAWAGMAFARLYSVTGEQKYLNGALRAADWIQDNAADTRGLGGYTGGYSDSSGNGTAMVRKDWKATEHNIDVGAFFAMLAKLTGDQTWAQRSENAFAFVRGMQADDGRLWTGTGNDGVTQNRDSVPEDIQTWSYLATLDPRYSRSIDWAATNLAATDNPVGGTLYGVSFAKSDTSKVWLEGTAHLLAAYHARRAPGDDAKAAVLQKTLQDAQGGAVPNADGNGIVAASSDGLTTGEGDIYYASLHTGATAWYILAGQGGNPFRL